MNAKTFGRLFSLTLTSTLVASYYLDFNYGLQFTQVMFWILVAIMAAMAIPFIHLLSKYDDGNLSEEDKLKYFSKDKKTGVLAKIYSGALSVTNILFLVVSGSPILAALYTLSTIASIAFLHGIEKRCK